MRSRKVSQLFRRRPLSGLLSVLHITDHMYLVHDHYTSGIEQNVKLEFEQLSQILTKLFLGVVSKFKTIHVYYDKPHRHFIESNSFVFILVTNFQKKKYKHSILTY